MKYFAVSDQYGVCRIIKAKTFRMACIEWVNRYRGVSNCKLFKIYHDKNDGSISTTGYGYGGSWLYGGEINMYDKGVSK